MQKSKLWHKYIESGNNIMTDLPPPHIITLMGFGACWLQEGSYLAVWLVLPLLLQNLFHPLKTDFCLPGTNAAKKARKKFLWICSWDSLYLPLAFGSNICCIDIVRLS